MTADHSIVQTSVTNVFSELVVDDSVAATLLGDSTQQDRQENGNC